MAQVLSTALPADVIPLASIIGLNAALALKAADAAVAKVDGSTPFTAPQSGVAATAPAHLVTKAQLDGVLGAASEIKPYANAAAADAAGPVLAAPMVVHLEDDGDGAWARYQITSLVATTFSAATKVKVADQSDITNLAGKADASALAAEATARIAADTALASQIDAPKWDAATAYAAGALVSFNGLVWSANAAPLPSPGDSPATVPAAWTRLVDAIIAAALSTYATQAWVSSQIAAAPWDVARAYTAGDVAAPTHVTRNGLVYRLLAPTTGDDPELFPLIWSLVTARAADLGEVKVSGADTSRGALSAKLVAGADVNLTILSPGGAETLQPGLAGNATPPKVADFTAVLARRRPLQHVSCAGGPVIAAPPAAPAEGEGVIFILTDVTAVNTFAFAPGATVRGALDPAGVTIADPAVRVCEVWYVNAAHGFDFRYSA